MADVIENYLNIFDMDIPPETHLRDRPAMDFLDDFNYRKSRLLRRYVATLGVIDLSCPRDQHRPRDLLVYPCDKTQFGRHRVTKGADQKWQKVQQIEIFSVEIYATPISPPDDMLRFPGWSQLYCKNSSTIERVFSPIFPGKQVQQTKLNNGWT